MTMTRREFLVAAAAIGASGAWRLPRATASRVAWRERRERFPEGVASGDPGPGSVVLWTRCPGTDAAIPLTVEIAEDPAFSRVVARTRTVARAENGWTVRVLAGGLKPGREHWYRFTTPEGDGSRVGRTVTGPRDDDRRAVRFAFVSCQDVTIGWQNAWRRMIHDDEAAAPDERLDFVLHLGDFVYEVVNYPEDRPQGYYDRTIREVFRYAHGEKQLDFHVPTDLDDYRTLYRAYLADPDIQDARARWPFVNMWDNHEFSWHGWQSFQNFGKGNIPAQTRRVAAMQAWWEFQPARVATPHASPALEHFGAPRVANAPITAFDEHGLGQEPNNLAAIASLTGYRALRFGRHLDLVLTDQHSYRSEDAFSRPEGDALGSADFPELSPQELLEQIDAGRAANGGHPPASLTFGATVPNFRRAEAPQTILGAAQKRWFLDRLTRSRATWKVWGNSWGTLDGRADPQHLPPGLTTPWPGAGYAVHGGGDWATAYHERGEIYDHVARQRITGFACVSGDRHSFWAGTMAKALPPAAFEPVGVAFVTGSISAVGTAEAHEHRMMKPFPLRALYLVDRPGAPPAHTVNMLLRHGVRSCLEYASSGDAARARALRDPDLAPHLDFVDLGGHGYATVRVDGSAMTTEFVCIPRPITRASTPDGGPLRYRLAFRAPLWRAGERPVLETHVLEGDPGLGA